MAYYALLGMGCWLVEMTVYLRYFGPLRSKYYRDAELIHGKIRKQNDSTIFWKPVAVIVFCPIFEEFIFRGPILLLVQHNQMVLSLMGTLIMGAIFGILHKYEDLGFYGDNTKAYYCHYDCLAIAFGGLCLGLITIVGVSLWPAIIAHGLWNGNLFLEQHSQKYNRVVNRYTMLLQR